MCNLIAARPLAGRLHRPLREDPAGKVAAFVAAALPVNGRGQVGRDESSLHSSGVPYMRRLHSSGTPGSAGSVTK